MNVQTEHLDNHTAKLTVEVEQERMQKAMQTAARQLANQLNIPGFRRGKAPYNVVARYVGTGRLASDALEKIGDSIYQEALKESGVSAYTGGELTDIKLEPTVLLTFIVPKEPETDLGNYRETLRLPYDVQEVTDEMLDRYIQDVRDRQAVIEPVSRPAQLGDQVKLHAKGTVTYPVQAEAEQVETKAESQSAETTEIPSEPETKSEQPETPAEPAPKTPETVVDEEDQDVEIFLRPDDEDYLPGFSAEVVGLSAGEEKHITYTIPGEQKAPFTDLAGATVDLTVKVEEVRNVTLPTLNDDFAKQASEGKQETLLDYRIESRKRLQDARKNIIDERYREQALETLAQSASFKYPDAAVEEALDDVLHDLEHNLSDRGLSLDDYLRIQKIDRAALRNDYRTAAISRLKRTLALTKLIQIERLRVSADEIEARIEEMSADFGEQAETFKRMLRQEPNYTSLVGNVLREKGLDRLGQIARGENPPIEAAEPAATESVAEQALPATTESTHSTESGS